MRNNWQVRNLLISNSIKINSLLFCPYCEWEPCGGYFHQNRMWICLPDLENLTFSIPIFCPISHPSVYHLRKTSTQFWPNWVLFTKNCPKYTQFMWFGILRLWWKEPPPITIPNFAKKHPKRQEHIRKPCQCETPLRRTAFNMLKMTEKYTNLKSAGTLHPWKTGVSPDLVHPTNNLRILLRFIGSILFFFGY